MKKMRKTWIAALLGLGLLAAWQVRVLQKTTPSSETNAFPNFMMEVVPDSNDSIIVRIKNPSHRLYYVIPYTGFRLSENSEGYCVSYKSPPHGLFTGYVILPGCDFELLIKLDKSNGSFRDDTIGQEVFPGRRDKVFLDAELKVADFKGGAAYTISKSCEIDWPLVDVYLSPEDIKIGKESSAFDGSIDKLPIME